MEPWQYLINQGGPEPTKEEQKKARAKYQRNLNNNNEPLSNKEKWANYLCLKNIKDSLKAKKEAGTFSNTKPWQYLINQGDSEPTKEEQKKARAKYQRNLKNNNEPLSDREKWANDLYQKRLKTSLKAKKEAGTFSNTKPWQHLINQGDSEPTKEEQKKARAKHRRNLKNNNEPLSDREKWGFNLYHKPKKASVKVKKEAGIKLDIIDSISISTFSINSSPPVLDSNEVKMIFDLSQMINTQKPEGYQINVSDNKSAKSNADGFQSTDMDYDDLNVKSVDFSISYESTKGSTISNPNEEEKGKKREDPQNKQSYKNRKLIR